MIPSASVLHWYPYVIFFLLIPTSAQIHGEHGEGFVRGEGIDNAVSNRGTRSSTLLFIRAVDRPISHADICLSKITFLLMSVNVPRPCRLIRGSENRRLRGQRGEHGKSNRKLGNGDRRGGRVKVPTTAPNDISYLHGVVENFFSQRPNGHPLGRLRSASPKWDRLL